jgi:hypothetical protein
MRNSSAPAMRPLRMDAFDAVERIQHGAAATNRVSPASGRVLFALQHQKGLDTAQPGRSGDRRGGRACRR